MRSKEDILEDLRSAVVSYDKDRVIRVAEEALNSEVDPLIAMEDGLAKGIREVGCKFGTEVFLSGLLMAADAMKAGVIVLEKAMRAEDKGKSVGTVVIGTVKGDIHDIGKNLVSTMLTVNGFKVMDLGVDVSSEAFIKKAEETSANIIALSSLLSTTMAYMEETIQLMRDLGCRDKYKVMVGGGQVTEKFAKEIGADGFGEEAGQAPALAKQLLAK